MFSEQDMEMVTQFLAPHIPKSWWDDHASKVLKSHGKSRKSKRGEPQEDGTRYELKLRKFGSSKSEYPSFPMVLAHVLLIYIGY